MEEGWRKSQAVRALLGKVKDSAAHGSPSGWQRNGPLTTVLTYRNAAQHDATRAARGSSSARCRFGARLRSA